MRMLIDAHMVGAQETGNETYMANLLRGLARVNQDDEVVVAAARPDLVSPLVTGARGVSIVQVSSAPVRRLLMDLPRIASRVKANVLCATYAGPPVLRCPQVVLVHDVSFRRHPEWFSPRDRAVLTLGVGTTMRRAAAVVTLSEFSRQEIAATYPAARDRVHVVPAAAAREFEAVTHESDERVRARHGLRRPYVLAVGNLQPRKNLVRLVEAFGRLASGRGLPHSLVLAGRAAWRGSAVEAAIVRLGLTGRVVTTGYVAPEDLPALYRGADVFVYPSLYEGFGLPVLEAMACGVPTIASNASAIPEVAGDAARLVDPESVEAIAAALEDLCGRAEARASLSGRGPARSRQFTWDRTAAMVLDILRNAARRP